MQLASLATQWFESLSHALFEIALPALVLPIVFFVLLDLCYPLASAVVRMLAAPYHAVYASHRAYRRWRRRFELAFEYEFEPEEPFIFRQKNDWTYDVDNAFTLRLLKMRTVVSEDKLATTSTSTSNLCAHCTLLDFTAKGFEATLDGQQLRQGMQASCRLCALISTSLPALLPTTTTNFEETTETKKSFRIYRQGSNLKVDGARSSSGEPFLTLVADPATWLALAKRLADEKEIQIGLPTIPSVPTADNPLYYDVLLAWLRVCDKQHKCVKGSSDRSLLPTRVLDVGEFSSRPSSSSGSFGSSIRLYHPSPGTAGRYLALSHCWGALAPKTRDRFCTYACNVAERSTRIDWADLPQTFRDAATVTRKLGIRYLWIDSMCIVQPHDDNSCSLCCRQQGRGSDWIDESKNMEAYYSSAYCTLAATSAQDANAGFLFRPESAAPPREERCVRMPVGLYVCPFVDTFDRDVEDGVLNRRGWVLQERALSRRVLHFTANQVYWECGKGIHCQTGTKMRSSTQQLMGDPQFPLALLTLVKGSRIGLFQHFFEMYSRLDLTYCTDRPVAIAGLEARLARALKTTVVYGIVSRYLHRSLLWQRGGGKPLHRINYRGSQRDNVVPSWSWMAYTGEIGYMDVPFATVEWNRSIYDAWNAKGDTSNSTATTIEFNVAARRFTLRGDDIQRVQFDMEGDKGRIEDDRVRCVVLGRSVFGGQGQEQGQHDEYYVLIVSPIPRSWADDLNGTSITYERVGVGQLLKSHISLEGPGTIVQIV